MRVQCRRRGGGDGTPPFISAASTLVNVYQSQRRNVALAHRYDVVHSGLLNYARPRFFFPERLNTTDGYHRYVDTRGASTTRCRPRTRARQGQNHAFHLPSRQNTRRFVPGGPIGQETGVITLLTRLGHAMKTQVRRSQRARIRRLISPSYVFAS